MEGSKLLKSLYFQNSRTQASDLKGLSKCVGQSKKKDSHEDILVRDFFFKHQEIRKRFFCVLFLVWLCCVACKISVS